MDPRITEAISQILIALLQVLGVILAGWAAKYVKARFTQTQIEKAERIAEIVVNAVEQMAAANGINYQAKFEEALKMARELAAGQGLAFNDAQWEGLIEAAVKQMKDIGTEIKKAPAV